jgi:hypothetical protein
VSRCYDGDHWILRLLKEGFLNQAQSLSEVHLYHSEYGVGACCKLQVYQDSSTSSFDCTREYRASSGTVLSFSECVLKCTDNATLSITFASFIQVATLLLQFLMQLLKNFSLFA